MAFLGGVEALAFLDVLGGVGGLAIFPQGVAALAGEARRAPAPRRARRRRGELGAGEVVGAVAMDNHAAACIGWLSSKSRRAMTQPKLSNNGSNGTCFVMQPFDRGKFDKRYTDVFEPSIRAAGLDAYRVDRDPGVIIPIDDIERGITDSSVCFAEITTDNPNVWFELGYAIATKKPVCMVCSKERDTPFPFDVRHRNIVTYDVGAPSDFAQLGTAITAKLAALLERQKSIESIVSLGSGAASDELEAHEAAMLAVLMTYHEDGAHLNFLRSDMRSAGYTSVATSIAIEQLRRLSFAKKRTLSGPDGDEFTNVCITDAGVDWVLSHKGKLNLRVERQPAYTRRKPSDDDIPF